MNIKTIFLICMVLLFTASYFGCSGETTEPAEIVRPVRYQQVQRSGGKMIRTFSGVSKAEAETNLSFRVGGIIQSINVEVGQRVKKGDLIAAIDTIDMVLQLEDARAGVENAGVQRETARSNLNRIRELYENNNIALSDYEGAKNQYASAKATYESKQKQLDLQKRQLSYGKLYAPVNGFIASVPVEKNENIKTGELVASLTSGKYIDVEVGMPDAFIHLIKPGLSTKVRFTSDLEKLFSGIVSKVSHGSSASSTYPVTVRLDTVTDKIRPGMPAEVTFDFETGDGGMNIYVPGNAVAEDTHGRFVFVVVEGPEKGFAIVHKKPVKVGVLTAAGFEVLEGLTEGELIVTSGSSKITDGLKVRLPR